MLSTDLARVMTEEREREVHLAMRLRRLLPARPRQDRPFLRLVRLPFVRLAAARPR